MKLDPPEIYSTSRPKKIRIDRYEKKRILDPRFTDKPNPSKHIKDYSFLYSKNTLDSLRAREERNRLENELVKRGKQKFYMKKKHKKDINKKNSTKEND
ncbi:hypothetical protein COBT_002480 [Conglomerata obtusa]